MQRGKIIGALVLVVAIGLIIIQMSGREEPAGMTQTPATAGVPASVTAADAWPASTAASYRVDPEGTELYWRIYRSGAMAALGHNHVISAGALEGQVMTGNSPADAVWNLTLPVDGLIIDDQAIRARYGEDFESEPSEQDKADTKDNMMTEGLLNGAVYPLITLNGNGVLGSLDDARLPVTIEIAGNTVELVLPASIRFDGNAVTVSGDVQMTHTQLGLEAFSMFGGAMAVAEEIDFTYSIRAIAGGQ